MDDSLNRKILNFMNSIDYNTKVDLKNVIASFKKNINSNEVTLMKANDLDIEKNAGYKINLDIINKIIDRVLSENIEFGNVLVSMESENEHFIYGKQINCTGNVLVISNGDTYALVDMLVKNILVNNAMFYTSKEYMYATNCAIINIFKKVLKEFKLSEFQVEIGIYDKLEKVLSNFTSFDLVVCLGDKDLQLSTLKYSKNKVLLSGFEYYDIYIETTDYNEFIKKIIESGVNVTIYTKKNIAGNFKNEIEVDSIDEAIAQINFSGSRFSSSIFTENVSNASKFLKEVKSSQVLVNTSPTIERVIDIRTRELASEKTLVYPINYEIKDIFTVDKKENETNIEKEEIKD